MNDFDALVNDSIENGLVITDKEPSELAAPPGGLRIDDAIPEGWPKLVSDLIKLSSKQGQIFDTSGGKPETSDIGLSVGDWSDRMVTFLDRMANGRTIKCCFDDGTATAVELMIWKTNALFSACLSTLKEAETLAAEAMTWDKALKDPNASIERMFAIKSRRPEYKDNAPPAQPGQINIQVNVAGKSFDVSANRTDDE